MAKFPINLLLYTTTLGLLGGSGFYFYEAVNLPQRPDQKKNRKAAMEAIERGKKSDPVVPGENYAEPEPWKSFASANYIGKLPPKVVERNPDKGPEKPKIETQTPLEDIFTVRGIYFDAAGSRVIIGYKPSANVQPPADQLKKMAAAQKRAQQPAATRTAANKNIRRGARGAPARHTPIPHNPNEAQVHHLYLEDAEATALWPPYEHIRLVSVSSDAEFAVFQRQEPSKEEQDWEEGIKMYKGSLALPRVVHEQLEKSRQGGSATSASGRKPAPRLDTGDSNPWRSTQNTRRVDRGRRGEWDIGQEELAHIRSDPARVFNEDVGLKSYVGVGGRKGLEVIKISSRLSGFDIRAGDIIIALNGESVGNKAQAVTLGKKLYKRGVRTFRVTILTSRGYTEERLYNAPSN